MSEKPYATYAYQYPDPQAIYEELDQYVVGQDEAKKTASMILWDIMSCRKRSINLFIGPTGSGKTYLTQTMLDLVPEMDIVTIDSPQLSASGWSGASVQDILLNADLSTVSPTIIFCDEADHIFRPQTNHYGQNFSKLLQKDFLKIIDSNTSLLKLQSSDNKRYGLISPKYLTFIFAGAFQELFEKDPDEHKTLGFTNVSDKKENGKKKITIQDLINFGMTREFAGRINRIVQFDEPDEKMMLKIGRKAVDDLNRDYDCYIRISDRLLRQITKQCMKNKLGARGIRNELLRYVDAQRFERPGEDEYRITAKEVNAL